MSRKNKQQRADDSRGRAEREPPEMSGPPGTLLAAAVILAAGVLVYQSSFTGVFLLDDVKAIVENPYIRSLRPLTQAMSAPPQSTVSGRPLVSLSLAVNYALGGLNPRGYHAFNLLVHLACGLLLFGLARRTLSSERLSKRYGDAAPMLAGIIALLWVVHPLQTESVTYVIQRTENMMGLCYLLTLYGAVRAFASPRPIGWQAAAVAACAAGMTCKEVMVTAPLMVLLYDRIFVADSFRQIVACRLRLYVGLAATWIILAALLAGGPRSATVGFGLEGLTTWEYARSQFGVIIFYLRLCFWPHPLCLDYGWPVARSLGEVIWPALLVLTLLAGTLWALHKRNPLGFAGAWFFVILAPTSSFVPIRDLAFEHRMYLPLAGVVALTVIGTHDLLSSVARGAASRWRRVLRPAAGGIVLVLAGIEGGMTYLRNSEYQDETRIWSGALAVRPDNFRVHHNLAGALHSKGRFEEAAQHCREALRIAPNYTDARNTLGVAMAGLGRANEAIDEYRAALQLDPNLVDAHYNLGNALQTQRKFTEAIDEYAAVYRLDPHHLRAYVMHANALREQGLFEESATVLRQGLAAARRDEDRMELARAHFNLGNCEARLERLDSAVSEYRAAVQLVPNYLNAYYGLGLALERQGKSDEAIQVYAGALAIKPDHAEIKQAYEALRENPRRMQR